MKDGNKINVVFRVILLTLAASFIYAVSSGVRNNYGIMLNSITSNSGISFASVSFVLAVGQLIYGLVQPAFGIIAAKKGNTFALISGIVFMLIGMLLTPLCKSLISLMLCLGFILPIGTGILSYGIIMGTITPKIPSKSVSVVSGVVNASSGIGNTAFSPLVNSLLKAGGLMYGMVILAIPVLLMLPISLLMNRGGEKRASHTVEAISLTSSAKPELNIGAMFEKAFNSRAYAYLMIGFFTCGFHMSLITNHLPTQIQSFGFSSEDAANAFSIYGVITIIGSVLSGALCGKFKMRSVLGFFYGLRPITILLFLLIPKTLLTVTVLTALFGFSGAATVPPVSMIISKTFGAESIATLFGFVFLVHQVGGFFGAWFGGICFDVMGSYTAMWAVSIVFSIAASAISFAIKEDRLTAE